MSLYRTNPDIDEYLGLGDINCDAVKSACAMQFPDDGSPYDSPVNRAFDGCLRDAGYYVEANKCFSSRSFDNPGATTYPLDVVTNPDNPDFIWRNPITWAVIAGAGMLLIFAMGKR